MIHTFLKNSLLQAGGYRKEGEKMVLIRKSIIGKHSQCWLTMSEEAT